MYVCRVFARNSPFSLTMPMPTLLALPSMPSTSMAAEEEGKDGGRGEGSGWRKREATSAERCVRAADLVATTGAGGE